MYTYSQAIKPGGPLQSLRVQSLRVIGVPLRGRHSLQKRNSLHFLRTVGITLLTAQLLAMIVWSTLIWSHFYLSQDYVIYHNAWWLIGRGDLNPIISPHTGSYPFWQNNFELMMWPLGLIAAVAPHGPVLGVIQDIAIFVAESVIFLWICELAEKRLSERTRIIAILVGLVLLVANPWVWQSISYDFHMELIGTCFLVLAARSLMKGRRAGWLWLLLAAMSGDATAAWIVGLGIGVLIAVPSEWRRAGYIAAIGAGYILLSVLLHGDMGGNPAILYGYLAGTGVAAPTLGIILKHIITHPSLVISTLWSRRIDIYANVAPGGLIGIASPIVLGIWLITLPMVDLVHNMNFAAPLYQEIALYILVPLGTIYLLIAILHRYPRTGRIFAGILVANAIAWSVVWAPLIYRQWLNVPIQTANVLRSVQKSIPPNAEVAVSPGVSGRFSDRRFDYPIYSGNKPIPIESHDTYWIVLPHVAATGSAATSLALVADLADHWHAHLIVHRAGVWAFHWQVPHNIHQVDIPTQPNILPGWTSTGHAGRSDFTGTPGKWAAVATGVGYVVSGDSFTVPPGTYRAGVVLSASTSASVEVWNDTDATLLTRHRIGHTHEQQVVWMTVNAKRIAPKSSYHGFGPFIIENAPGQPGDTLEIRVSSLGVSHVRVYKLILKRIRTGK